MFDKFVESVLLYMGLFMTVGKERDLSVQVHTYSYCKESSSD